MAILSSDSFNRANNTTAVGSTDIAYGGSLGSLAWTTLTGTCGISSNQAYPSATASPVMSAVVDLGTADVDLLVTATSSSGIAGVVFRAVDASNFWYFGSSNGSNISQLWHIVSGSTTQVGANVAGGVDGDLIRVIAVGSTIQCFRNGHLVMQVTDSTFSTATKHGFCFSNISGRADNWIAANGVLVTVNTPTVVNSWGYTETAAGTTHALTGMSTSTGNTRLVAIAYRGLDSLVSSITDSNGGAYRRLSQWNNTTTALTAEIWALQSRTPAALSGTLTVTTTSSISVAFRLYELSGVLLPLTAEVGSLVSAAGNSGSGTAISAGGHVGYLVNDLAFVAMATDGSATVSPSSFTAGAASATNIDFSNVSGSALQLATAYLPLTVLTSQTYTATLGTTHAWAVANTRLMPLGPTYTAPQKKWPVVARRSVSAIKLGGAVPVTPPTQGQFLPPIVEPF